MTITSRERVRRDNVDAPPPSEEYALLDFVQRLQRYTAGRLAVHIHLSRLQSYNRRDHHIRVAISTFEDLVKQFDGRLFQMRNNDIIFVCKGAKISDIDEAVFKLRYLFSEDPLTRYSDDQTDGGFCTWYTLETDYSRLLTASQRLFDLGEAQRKERERRETADEQPRSDPVRAPLTPDILEKLVRALEKADLSSLVHNQPICAIRSDSEIEPVLNEKFVSISSLEQTALDNTSLTSDPWLFKYLTHTLDRRMMRQILNDHTEEQQPFSLNLNVATVLSPDFQRFDRGIALGIRGRLVIELQKVDIFADMGAYLFARDFLRERGYKICLDGLTHLTLPYIDRERLGLDLLKIFWSPELLTTTRPEIHDELEQHVYHTGRARIIMARCDDKRAIEYGQRLGITLFQGRYVDQLLNAQRPDWKRQGSLRRTGARD